MPDFQIHIPLESPLLENLSGLPPDFKTYLGKGFTVLSRLSEDKFLALVDIAQDYLAVPVSANRAEVTSKFGINSEDAMALMTATSFVTFTLTSRPDSAEGFIHALIAAKVIPETHQPNVLRLAGNNRVALKEILERSRVAGALLPSLTQFETTIDLRLGFERNQVGFAVPVVLMHVDTDAQGEELWLQVNKKQLDNLIKDLEEARRRLGEAEKWAQSRLARE